MFKILHILKTTQLGSKDIIWGVSNELIYRAQ